MFYSVGFTQILVYLERHLNGFVPTVMEDLSVLWSKEIYLRVWIWTSMYRRALASGQCFSRLMQANCLMLSRCTFPRFTATLTTRSCMCLSFQTKAAAAPQLWNSWAYAIRSSPSVASFKKTLKTSLFQKAFLWFYVLFNLVFSRFYVVFTI